VVSNKEKKPVIPVYAGCEHVKQVSGRYNKIRYNKIVIESIVKHPLSSKNP